jgi:hypothetical protein
MATLDAARWPAVSALLDELLDLDAQGRAERLISVRARGEGLVADEVERLLAFQAEAERQSFLNELPPVSVAPDPQRPWDGFSPPTRWNDHSGKGEWVASGSRAAVTDASKATWR